METIKRDFFTETGVLIGRSVRILHRGIDSRITVTILPIVLMLLFLYVSFMLVMVYVFVSAIQITEEIFFEIFVKTEEKK